MLRRIITADLFLLRRVACPNSLSLTRRTMGNDTVHTLDVGSGRKVAYKLYEGRHADPTVVFVPGFMSTMDGFKAKALEKFCVERDRRFIRFDFEGIGKSPGDLSKLFIRFWIEDLKCIIENLIPQKVLLVGSSMGGWFALKVGMEMPDKIHSMLLVAPALNFFKFYYDYFYKTISEKERAILDSGEVLVLKKNYGDIFLRKSLMEESINHHLDLNKPIPVSTPIRILHGVLDPDVPYKQSLQIMQAVTSKDVDVIFRKDGKHQMSEPADLQLLINTLTTLL